MTVWAESLAERTGTGLDKGRATPHFRPGSTAKVRSDLAKLIDRAEFIATKMEAGGEHETARQILSTKIKKELSEDTIAALDRAISLWTADDWRERVDLGACLDNSGLWWRRLAEIEFCLLMSKTFRPWTIDQPLLLPPSVQDFVGEDHLARLILALVLEPLDLGEIEAAYASERGQPPFDPAMMTALSVRLLQRRLLVAPDRQGGARTGRLPEHCRARSAGFSHRLRLPQAALEGACSNCSGSWCERVTERLTGRPPVYPAGHRGCRAVRPDAEHTVPGLPDLAVVRRGQPGQLGQVPGQPQPVLAAAQAGYPQVRSCRPSAARRRQRRCGSAPARAASASSTARAASTAGPPASPASLGGQRTLRRGLERRRVAVPPAAVESPDGRGR